ncbi:MAG: DNA-deoxyinosine glycosylase [Eubacteriales bacterium]|nr:DNA-deoxyinosine glycosylase [Eubacteriales bacterium]
MADTYIGIAHPFAPVYNASSRVLVLGTFPSVKSRENAFYYGHPQNRFWRVLASLFGAPVPNTIPEKRALLLQNGIALWDVLASCDITGSADLSIRKPVPNDIAALLSSTSIHTVFCNGQTAGSLYHRWCEPLTTLPATILPSTSPANARWTLDMLSEAWKPLLG